jgi:hypothetical protein
VDNIKTGLNCGDGRLMELAKESGQQRSMYERCWRSRVLLTELVTNNQLYKFTEVTFSPLKTK